MRQENKEKQELTESPAIKDQLEPQETKDPEEHEESQDHVDEPETPVELECREIEDPSENVERTARMVHLDLMDHREPVV